MLIITFIHHLRPRLSGIVHFGGRLMRANVPRYNTGEMPRAPSAGTADDLDNVGVQRGTASNVQASRH